MVFLKRIEYSAVLKGNWRKWKDKLRKSPRYWDRKIFPIRQVFNNIHYGFKI